MSDVRGAIGSALLHVPHPHRHSREGTGTALNPTVVLSFSCVTLFMIGVNTTAINTALNAIAQDLSLTPGELGWTVGTYMLAVAAFVVVGGTLGDMLGERTMVIAGLSIFAAAAALVAASDSAWMLILGRFAQGAGAAVLTPATMAVLRIAYPPERQGFALGIWGATGGLAFATGPLIGGVLTDLVSWRWLWWSTTILSVGLAWMALGVLRGMPKPTERPKLDLVGTGLLALSLFSLILAIQQGPEWGWASARTLAAFAVAALGLVSLIAFETRSAHPLLNLRLLRIPALAAANLGTFVNALGLIGILFFFNLYAQSIVTLDYSAVLASVALLPYGACVFGASLLIGGLCDRVGFRWPIASGLILLGAGSLLLGMVDAASGYGDIWWASMILGVGVGVTFSAPSAAGLRAVDDEHAGQASGIINVLRYLAAALVVTLGTVLFTSVGSDELNRTLDRAGVPRVEQERLDETLTGAPARVEAAERTLDERDRAAFRSGAADGIAGGFAAVMLALGVIALISSLAWILLMRPARAP